MNSVRGARYTPGPCAPCDVRNTMQASPGPGRRLAIASSTRRRVASMTRGWASIFGAALSRTVSAALPERRSRSSIRPVALSNTGREPSPATTTATHRCGCRATGASARGGGTQLASTASMAAPKPARIAASRVTRMSAGAASFGASSYLRVRGLSAHRTLRTAPCRTADRLALDRQPKPPPKPPYGVATA